MQEILFLFLILQVVIQTLASQDEYTFFICTHILNYIFTYVFNPLARMIHRVTKFNRSARKINRFHVETYFSFGYTSELREVEGLHRHFPEV